MKHLTALALAAVLLAAITVFSACVRVEPQISGTPTPAASPTPLPDPFDPVRTAAPVETDILGKRVESEHHYYHYYLSFGDLRVYEYGTGTLLDGVCVNAYPLPLDGEASIVYYSEDGRVAGKGRIHNAEGTTLLKSGSNAVYAEIQTDIDVQGMGFVIEFSTPYLPVAEESSKPNG